VHVERELKFRVENVAAARRLQRTLPLASRLRRQQVHSIYYDTPDLRLQRAEPRCACGASGGAGSRL